MSRIEQQTFGKWNREFWERKRAEEKRGNDFLAALRVIEGGK